MPRRGSCKLCNEVRGVDILGETLPHSLFVGTSSARGNEGEAVIWERASPHHLLHSIGISSSRQVMVPASAGSVSMPDHPDVERASNCSHVVTSELARPPVVYLVSCCLHPDELDESGLRLQGKESLDCF